MPTPPVRPVSAQLTEETGNGVQTEAHSRGFVVVYEILRAVQQNCNSESKQNLLQVARIPRGGNVFPARDFLAL